MSSFRVAYVDGRYQRADLAHVAVEDRGFQLADGVYEVAPVANGRIIDFKPHFDRFARSLGELSIQAPVPPAALNVICREVVERNRIVDGILYVQASRGAAPRDHGFPKQPVRPTLVASAKWLSWPSDAGLDSGAAIITTPDLRWGRCDIKSTALLANVLAKQKAREAGAFEAWFVRPDGTITEGASTNAWMVDADGRLLTRPLGPEILPGITRATVLRLARQAGYEVIERPFRLDELSNAREAFLTSTTSLVRAVVSVDGRPIANGHPGEIASRLRALCLTHYRAPAS
ncbi:MAG: D-amino-acid transaminase [Alphaproteobacteria bacterium]